MTCKRTVAEHRHDSFGTGTSKHSEEHSTTEKGRHWLPKDFFCMEFVIWMTYAKLRINESVTWATQPGFSLPGPLNELFIDYSLVKPLLLRFQQPSGLKRGSTADRLLGSRVRIPPEAWRSVSYECRVLRCRGLCVVPISRAEESYRLWCVTVCDLETSRVRRPWPALGCCAKEQEDDSVLQPSKIQNTTYCAH